MVADSSWYFGQIQKIHYLIIGSSLNLFQVDFNCKRGEVLNTCEYIFQLSWTFFHG
jgi:hypothetical protein